MQNNTIPVIAISRPQIELSKTAISPTPTSVTKAGIIFVGTRNGLEVFNDSTKLCFVLMLLNAQTWKDIALSDCHRINAKNRQHAIQTRTFETISDIAVLAKGPETHPWQRFQLFARQPNRQLAFHTSPRLFCRNLQLLRPRPNPQNPSNHVGQG